MIDKCLHYLSLCFSDIPRNMSIGLLLAYLIGSIFLFSFLGYRKGVRWSAALLLLVYCVLMISLTVIFREVRPTKTFDFALFWSYRAIRGGEHEILMTQMIANVVAFIPIGFLLGIFSPNIKWWKVLLIGGAFSFLIETLQFFCRRGFAEFDDVWHNVMGCMVGFGVFVWVRWIVKRACMMRVYT